MSIPNQQDDQPISEWSKSDKRVAVPFRTEMLFFAGSGYSRAVDYADEVGTALFLYDEIGIVAAHN